MDSFPPQLVNSLLWQTPQLQQHLQPQPQPPQPHQQQHQHQHQQQPPQAFHGFGSQHHHNHQMSQYPLQLQQLAQIGQRQTHLTPASDIQPPQLFPHVDIGGGASLPMKIDNSGSISFASLSASMSAGPFGSAAAAAPFLSANTTTSPSSSDQQTATASPGLRVTIPKNLNGHSTSHQDHISSGLDSSTSPVDADETSSQSGVATGEGTHSPEPSGDSSSKKRHRLRPDQTRRLLEVFDKTTKPDSEMRKALGKQLDMAPRTVQIWFQNRRAKLKRESNASDPLKMTGYFGSGIYANRGRLSYNRAYLDRRHMGGRNVSEGFDHFRSAHGFEPYPPQEPFRGLPLQNPSQMATSNSTTDMSPHFTLQSIPGAPPVFDQSAMGIPAGQGPNGAASTHLLSGAMAASVMPHHASAHAATTGYKDHTSPQLSTAQGQVCVQPVALQLQSANQDGSTRGRQAQPHTPVDGNMACDDYIASMAFGTQRSPQQQKQQQPIPHSRQTHGFSASAVPSAEVLLQSRRRHLQDLMIINQTHAARGINPAALPTSGPDIGDGGMGKPLLFSELTQTSPLVLAATAPASLSMPPPPLITASSFVDATTMPHALASAAADAAATPAPSSQLATLHQPATLDSASSAANMHGTLGSNTSNDDGVVMATASLDSLVAGNAMVGIGDAGQGGGDANALISGSSLAGLTAGITSVAQTPLLASAASAPTPHPAGPLLSPNCPGSDTASPGQYQLLNDLLLQCNAFDFLNNAGFGSSDMQNSVNGTSMAAGIVQFGQQQIQPSSDELSPCASSAPAIPSTSGAESAACTSFDNGFGDISIASAESLFSDTSALASAVAAAYMHNEDASLSSACSTSGPPTDSSVTPPHTHVKCDGAAATVSSSAEDSFTVGSISSSRAMDTPLAAVLSQKQGANHLPLHSAAQTSLGPGSMPKVGSNTSVVVATSNRLILQRDPLVEQIYTESLPF